jgi:MFS family permease
MIWGPISESYGRKWTITAAFVVFTVFSIASAVSPNFAALVVFRFLVGVGGSCAISVVGGICADVYHNPISRGRSMAIFMVSCASRRFRCGKIGMLIMSIGCDDLWAYSRAPNFGLHQCRVLELGVLDWRHLRRCYMAGILLLP